MRVELVVRRVQFANLVVEGLQSRVVIDRGDAPLESTTVLLKLRLVLGNSSNVALLHNASPGFFARFAGEAAIRQARGMPPSLLLLNLDIIETCLDLLRHVLILSYNCPHQTIGG